jgi:predicted metal-dependent hydrolase
MRTEYTLLSFDNYEIPVKIVREHRHSIRCAFGKDHLIIRFPVFIDKTDEQRYQQHLRTWLLAQEAGRPGLLTRYERRGDYKTGDTLIILGKPYQINLLEEERKTSVASLTGDHINLRISQDLSGYDRRLAIRSLLSKLLSNIYTPVFQQRTHELAAQHFSAQLRRPVKNVRFKYNHSNWGSCSNTGNINLSTRLLLAPREVIDYVIIHELAHLIELNHSDRFWYWVASAMPDYTRHEKWLKENGHQCDF